MNAETCSVVATYHDNRRAFLKTKARDRLSNAGASAGYDDYLVLESKIHGVPLTKIEVAPVEGKVCAGDERCLI